MKRSTRLLAVIAVVLAAVVPAGAQLPELVGVSDFLAGFWKHSGGEATQVALHNPSPVSRLAVLLYYDDDQNFRNCQVERLSPHDFSRLPLVFDGAPPDYDQHGNYGAPGPGGALEIRSMPEAPENPNTPGGLVGYIELFKGLEPQEAGATRAIAPLFPVDVELFTATTPLHSSAAVDKCICPKLEASHTPALNKLKAIFCPRIR